MLALKIFDDLIIIFKEAIKKPLENNDVVIHFGQVLVMRVPTAMLPKCVKI